MAMVLTGDETTLAALVDKLHQESREEESCAASSRDMGSLVRAGPCPGYENLKPISALKAFRSRIRACARPAEMMAITEEAKLVRKQIATLVQSCKTALADLTGARARSNAAKDNAKMAEQKRQKEDAPDRRKAAASKAWPTPKKSRLGMPCIFELPQDQYPIHSTAAWQEHLHLDEPLIVSGVSQLFECHPQLRPVLADFASAFDEPTLKVTDGRAHFRMAPDPAKAMVDAAAGLVPEPIQSDEGRHVEF